MQKRMIVYTPFLLARRLWRKLWVRVTGMAVLAVLVSGATMLFEPLMPDALRARLGPSAVLPVLTILASGMLAVSTFSLNVMVSAHRAAASQATPRAHRVLLDDTTTHSVLATFIGAFVYALSAIILLKSGLHLGQSAVISMIATVAVVALVIIAMLRWIDHLSDLGSMDATLRRVEAEAHASLMQTRHAPNLHASPMTPDIIIPADADAIPAPVSGYLQLISVAEIDKVLASPGANVWLTTSPGDFVLKGEVMGYASGLDRGGLKAVQAGLSLGDERSFEQDAGFGLLILSETASRALSPGINDPGTAIDVIARLEKLLWEWAHTSPEPGDPDYPRIFIPNVAPHRLIENAFAATARDGAGMIEVVERLLKALKSLQDSPDTPLAEAAAALTKAARAYAEKTLILTEERDKISDSA